MSSRHLPGKWRWISRPPHEGEICGRSNCLLSRTRSVMALVTSFPRLLGELHSAGAHCQNSPKCGRRRAEAMREVCPRRQGFLLGSCCSKPSQSGASYSFFFIPFDAVTPHRFFSYNTSRCAILGKNILRVARPRLRGIAFLTKLWPNPASAGLAWLSAYRRSTIR